MASNSTPLNQIETISSVPDKSELDRFAAVANKVADAAGEVIRKYFRKPFDIIDKEDSTPVTIADRETEEAMVSVIQECFPSHAILGEESGWRCKEEFADYVWVLDPIDGTESFITGKPLFGTLIALLHKGKPVVGIIDQPILRERWIGISGKRTTLNGEEVSTRNCETLLHADQYTTSPHHFSEDAEVAFARVGFKAKAQLYGCDCYAYALLASGFADLVMDFGLEQNLQSCCMLFTLAGSINKVAFFLQPFDFLALIPVVEGAGGVITDWKGHHLQWEPASHSCPTAEGFTVLAAGDEELHQQAVDALQWT
ncbi:hypothetical protein Vadar_024429 [Vaccinium darrowii]|nr:hypothetical protein Vadar_024429 [Vaccinium darrowii]